MALQPMYPGQVNSPQTELASAIDDEQTTIPLLDASVLPDPPNICTIGTGEDAETVLYTGKSGNNLTGVTRGFQGAAKSWGAGVKVARNFTAYDYDALRENLEDHAAATTGVHGATSAATPNTIVQRDPAGRFKAAAPVAADDVARKAEVDDAIEYALPKQARVLILNPGEYSDLDLSQYDAVRVLTSSGDVIINNILNNMPGHRCRLVKVNSSGSLILKAGGNANWWQGGQDIVIGPDDRYGFVDLQWLENGTVYANAVIDNGQKYARLGEDITASRLRLTVTTDVSPTSTGHAFQIGWDDSQNLAMDTNEIMVRDGAGGMASLHINAEGGAVTINNTAPEGGFRFESGRFYIKNVQFIVESGNPNGNVAAPPGSIYLNTSGGAGTSLYVKESGTGNTGWVAK